MCMKASPREESFTTNSNVNDAGNVGTGNPFDVYDQDESMENQPQQKAPLKIKEKYAQITATIIM